MSSRLTKLKRWPSWLLMLVCAGVLMFLGTQRDSGPTTAQERIEAISQRLACPTCDGESVHESRSPGSQAIRQEITRQVADGVLTDGQIVRMIDDSYAADLKLIPSATGFDALIWVLPVAAFVAAVGGLIIVFRRWRREGSLVATQEDQILVTQARQDKD
jgi:cytochrome c-type biogenesis protein CcmH